MDVEGFCSGRNGGSSAVEHDPFPLGDAQGAVSDNQGAAHGLVGRELYGGEGHSALRSGDVEPQEAAYRAEREVLRVAAALCIHGESGYVVLYVILRGGEDPVGERVGIPGGECAPGEGPVNRCEGGRGHPPFGRFVYRGPASVGHRYKVARVPGQPEGTRVVRVAGSIVPRKVCPKVLPPGSACSHDTRRAAASTTENMADMLFMMLSPLISYSQLTEME